MIYHCNISLQVRYFLMNEILFRYNKILTYTNYISHKVHKWIDSRGKYQNIWGLCPTISRSSPEEVCGFIRCTTSAKTSQIKRNMKKIFLRGFPLSRSLAKALRVNKICHEKVSQNFIQIRISKFSCKGDEIAQVMPLDQGLPSVLPLID